MPIPRSGTTRHGGVGVGGVEPLCVEQSPRGGCVAPNDTSETVPVKSEVTFSTQNVAQTHNGRGKPLPECNVMPARERVSCVTPDLCSAQECPEGSSDFRGDQCSQFDGSDFQGKRYKWLPYYGGQT